MILDWRGNISVLGICLSLGGCANSFSLSSMFDAPPGEPVQKMQPEPVMVSVSDDGIRYRAESKDMQPQRTEPQRSWLEYRTPESLYQPQFSHKSLSDYAEQLSMQLIQNASNMTTDSRVGVASFVNFDSSLQNTTALGNQLAEMMVTQVQQYGISVVDFKAMNNIQVNPQGDIVFSRDARRLATQTGTDYVLSGTLIQNEKGVTVNARIVAMNSKVLVSSATVHIPHFIVQSLQPRVQRLTQAP